MRIKIKICGITNLNDARAAVDAGADGLGFVFSKSPRRITSEAAKNIISKLPPFICKVGVFVNAGKAEVLKILKKCQLDTLQFHGEESDKYCAFFKKYCKIIKAFRIKDDIKKAQIIKYKNVDAYLFDSYVKGIKGGTGHMITYKRLENMNFDKPIIIAGGITAQNFKKICNKLAPFALDISSSIEVSPGKKNPRKMRKLIESAGSFKK